MLCYHVDDTKSCIYSMTNFAPKARRGKLLTWTIFFLGDTGMLVLEWKIFSWGIWTCNHRSEPASSARPVSWFSRKELICIVLNSHLNQYQHLATLFTAPWRCDNNSDTYCMWPLQTEVSWSLCMATIFVDQFPCSRKRQCNIYCTYTFFNYGTKFV